MKSNIANGFELDWIYKASMVKLEEKWLHDGNFDKIVSDLVTKQNPEMLSHLKISKTILETICQNSIPFALPY